MLAIHVIFAIGVVVLMDWATYGRLLLSGEVLWSVTPGYRYRDTLFPRVIVTIFSGALIGAAYKTDPLNFWLFFSGVAGAVLSVFYAIVVTSIR
jgi:hypothetical protein